MVRKEDVYGWFKESSSAQRVEVMCNLLHLCIPFELRFVGSCLEDLARQSFLQLREQEQRANDVDTYTALVSNNNNMLSHASSDLKILGQLNVLVSLLGSTNTRCANKVFEILSSLSQRLRIQLLTSRGSSGQADDQDLMTERRTFDDLILLLTMCALHPAFIFSQRDHLHKMLTDLRQILDSCGLMPDHCSSITKVDAVLETDPELLVDVKCVDAAALSVANCISSCLDGAHALSIEVRYNYNPEYLLQVVWSNNTTTEVRRYERDLKTFHNAVGQFLAENGESSSLLSLPQLPTAPGKSLQNQRYTESLQEYFRKLLKVINSEPHLQYLARELLSADEAAQTMSAPSVAASTSNCAVLAADLNIASVSMVAPLSITDAINNSGCVVEGRNMSDTCVSISNQGSKVATKSNNDLCGNTSGSGSLSANDKCCHRDFSYEFGSDGSTRNRSASNSPDIGNTVREQLQNQQLTFQKRNQRVKENQLLPEQNLLDMQKLDHHQQLQQKLKIQQLEEDRQFSELDYQQQLSDGQQLDQQLKHQQQNNLGYQSQYPQNRQRKHPNQQIDLDLQHRHAQLDQARHQLHRQKQLKNIPSPSSSSQPPNDLSGWLKVLRLHKYKQLLQYSLNELLNMTKEDLTRLELTVGACNRFLSAKDTLRYLIPQEAPLSVDPVEGALSNQVLYSPQLLLVSDELASEGTCAVMSQSSPDSVDSSCSEYSTPPGSPEMNRSAQRAVENRRKVAHVQFTNQSTASNAGSPARKDTEKHHVNNPSTISPHSPSSTLTHLPPQLPHQRADHTTLSQATFSRSISLESRLGPTPPFEEDLVVTRSTRVHESMSVDSFRSQITVPETAQCDGSTTNRGLLIMSGKSHAISRSPFVTTASVTLSLSVSDSRILPQDSNVSASDSSIINQYTNVSMSDSSIRPQYSGIPQLIDRGNFDNTINVSSMIAIGNMVNAGNGVGSYPGGTTAAQALYNGSGEDEDTEDQISLGLGPSEHLLVNQLPLGGVAGGLVSNTIITTLPSGEVFVSPQTSFVGDTTPVPSSSSHLPLTSLSPPVIAQSINQSYPNSTMMMYTTYPVTLMHPMYFPPPLLTKSSAGGENAGGSSTQREYLDNSGAWGTVPPMMKYSGMVQMSLPNVGGEQQWVQENQIYAPRFHSLLPPMAVIPNYVYPINYPSGGSVSSLPPGLMGQVPPMHVPPPPGMVNSLGSLTLPPGASHHLVPQTLGGQIISPQAPQTFPPVIPHTTPVASLSQASSIDEGGTEEDKTLYNGGQCPACGQLIHKGAPTPSPFCFNPMSLHPLMTSSTNLVTQQQQSFFLQASPSIPSQSHSQYRMGNLTGVGNPSGVGNPQTVMGNPTGIGIPPSGFGNPMSFSIPNGIGFPDGRFQGGVTNLGSAAGGQIIRPMLPPGGGSMYRSPPPIVPPSPQMMMCSNCGSHVHDHLNCIEALPADTQQSSGQFQLNLMGKATDAV